MTPPERVLAEAGPRGARVDAPELVGGVLTHAPESDGLRFLSALDRLCTAISDEARLTEAGRRPARRPLVSPPVPPLRPPRPPAPPPPIRRPPLRAARGRAPLVLPGT